MEHLQKLFEKERRGIRTCDRRCVVDVDESEQLPTITRTQSTFSTLVREFKKLAKFPFSFNILFNPNEEIVVCILPGTSIHFTATDSMY
jgi:hypothetical protein